MPDNAKPSIDELFNLRASFPTDEERREFFSAADNSDIRRLEKIIDKWPDAPAKWYDSYGKPVLMSAYNKISFDAIEFLVSKGADMAQPQRDGSYNALIYAAFLGSLQDVEKFLRAGADPNAADKNGHNALHLAVGYNPKPEIIDLLVVCGSDPKAKNQWGKSALDECKTPDLRDIIVNAQTRRAAFLQSYKAQAAQPTTANAPDDDSDEIKLLKRIELRKGGDEPAAAKPATTSATGEAKKSWWKRTFG